MPTLIYELALLHTAGSGNVASGQQSDHLLMVAAFDGWTAATAQVRAEPLQS